MRDFSRHFAEHTTLVGKPESLGEDAQATGGFRLFPGTQILQNKAFEIVEQLGEGGMGQVYKVYDPSMDRYIALKVLKPEVPETERMKFRREAVVAANFSHPNLVRVLEVGSRRDIQWMAMEYLRGRDIGEVIANRKAISFRVLCDIFGQALDGLQYIHVRSIVHCDIKPENIFVTRDAYDRRMVIVKIIDFGIARNIDGPVELQTYISGDPRYMAPEQTVLNGPIDGRADLYALGMSMYECVCRRHPFEQFIDEGPQVLIKLHRTGAFPPPSAYMPENTPPALAAAFDAFTAKACAKNPDDRFKDAAAMRKGMNEMVELLDTLATTGRDGSESGTWQP